MLKENNWYDELKDALTYEDIVDPEFFYFMEGKVKRLSLSVEDFGWGVFPLIDDDGIVYDIRMVVPVITNEKTLCVNIHEYTHAYEIYNSLGKVYEWHEEESEKKALEAEQRYLMRKQ